MSCVDEGVVVFRCREKGPRFVLFVLRFVCGCMLGEGQQVGECEEDDKRQLPGVVASILS